MDYDKQYKTSLDKPDVVDKGERKGMKWFGITLAVIGFMFLFERFVPLFELLAYWPFLLILIGGLFVWKSNK